MRGALAALLALAVIPGPCLAGAAQDAGTEAKAAAADSPELSIHLAPAAVEKLIRAAVPYDIQLDVGVFVQLVRISEPRDIRLFPGGLTLRARATGSPVPLDAELEPVIRLERTAAGGFQVRVESLPVRIGWAGTFDLAGSIPVTPIESLAEFALDMPERSIPVQLKVTAIQVDTGGIRVEMQTRYP